METTTITTAATANVLATKFFQTVKPFTDNKNVSAVEAAALVTQARLIHSIVVELGKDTRREFFVRLENFLSLDWLNESGIL